MLKLSVITTGGTIEKVYSEQTSTVENLDNQIHRYLGRLRLPDCDVHVTPLMNKDSLEMTDADRALIVNKCMESPENRIVITHGTDTMTDTAAVIAKTITDKTIVLTGAMIPWAFGSSDGLFNLGSALSFVQVLPPGVYVAMNGKCFPWDRVRKNRALGEFEEIL